MLARSGLVRRLRVPCGGALLAAGLALLAAGCNDSLGPRQTSGEPPVFAGNFDGARLEFRLDAPDGSPSELALVAQGFDFDATTRLLRAQVAVRNEGPLAVPGPESIIVFEFVPADIVPQNAACSEGNPAYPHDACAFDHRGTYGETGLLGPGATSSPVEWILLVPSGESFAFRARLGDPEPGPGTIAGVVFADADLDGHRDASETGIEDVEVRLHAGPLNATARTDALGRYAFTVSEPGLYELTIESTPGVSPTTPLPLQVVILQRDDGSLSSFTLGDIGLAGGPTGPPVRLQGIAYHDLNRNGIYDDGEPGLAGVEIRGEACEDDDDDEDDDDGEDEEGEDHDVLASSDDFVTVTDADGRWVLLMPDCGGPWSVRGGSVDGYERTTPRTVTFYAVFPDEVLIADFGYAPEDPSRRYQIRGVVYLDQNRNGVQDVHEPGMPGVLVSASGLQCARPAATDVTDSKGRYKLTGEEIGCPLPWRVERGPVVGVVATTPPIVEIASPPVRDGKFWLDFGVAPPPAWSAATGPGATSATESR